MDWRIESEDYTCTSRHVKPPGATLRGCEYVIVQSRHHVEVPLAGDRRRIFQPSCRTAKRNFNQSACLDELLTQRVT